MAFTYSALVKTVFGNQRVEIGKVTADANSGAIDSGIATIEAHSFSPISFATFSRVKCKINTNSAGTTLNGTVFFSSCTNGDEGYLVLFGR